MIGLPGYPNIRFGGLWDRVRFVVASTIPPPDNMPEGAQWCAGVDGDLTFYKALQVYTVPSGAVRGALFKYSEGTWVLAYPEPKQKDMVLLKIAGWIWQEVTNQYIGTTFQERLNG